MIRRGMKLAVASAWLVVSILAIAVPACAAQAPEQTRQSSPSVSELIDKVKRLPDSQDRRDAARELSMIEPLPLEAIQALAEAMWTTEHNGPVERYAITAIVKAG